MELPVYTERMSNNVWAELHKGYEKRGWIDKSSLFAETALRYFPAKGRLLELGAGQGQDSRFFAEHGYEVVSTDLEETALAQSRAKLPGDLRQKVIIQKVDLRQELPFGDGSFDIVYAHLSLHYFDERQTEQLFSGIERVLKPGGMLAFLVNSTNDPEYATGQKIEDDYFRVEKKPKRYFSLATTGEFTRRFDAKLLDDRGETYKDRDKGVSNLIRFIGTKS